jgi:hypothetical protein
MKKSLLLTLMVNLSNRSSTDNSPFDRLRVSGILTPLEGDYLKN